MSPVPRRTSRKLPLTSQQLSAFDKARKAKTVSERRKAVSAIVSASFSDGISLETDSAKYVLNRLLNAISVSSNQTRLNSSTALIAFIRALRKAAPKTTEKQIISAVSQLYAIDGSFQVDYRSGERERAIGTITACAALVRAYNGKLQPLTCKEIVSLLRPCVLGNCAKWQLANSCVHIVCEFLRAGDSTAIQDACAKSLWQWCEERKNYEDGLSLVLNLLQLGIASQNAVKRIYPDLDSIAKALATTFETGFSYHSGDLGADLVPLSWKLALNYVFSSDGQEHLGSPEKFWKRVVAEDLIHSGGSMAKKILALDLLHLALPLLKEQSTFESIFDSSLSSLIIILRSQGKAHQGDIVVRGINFPKAQERMNESLSVLGESIAEWILVSASEKSASLWQLFFLWAVRNGVMPHVLSPGKLNEILGSIKIDNVRRLFCVMINEFACPESQKSRLSVQATRLQTLGFVFKLASMFPSLVNDVVRIFLFYAVCDDSCYQSGNLSEDEELTLDVYKPPSDVTLVHGLLPVPSPAISHDVATSVFSKLVGFVSENQNTIDGHASLVSFCYHHLKLMMSWKWVKHRNHHDIDDDSDGGVSGRQEVLETHVEPILISLSKARQHGQKGFLDALQLLVEFVGLVLLKPCLGSKRQIEKSSEDRSFCVSLTQELSQIVSLLQKAKTMDADKERDVEMEDSDRQPDATERVTKLLCEICTRCETIPLQIALRVIDDMNHSVDDRVVAVLFDAMEETLHSNENLADSGIDEDSDESEEDESLTTSDCSDSDESESEVKVDDEGREKAKIGTSLSNQDEEIANTKPAENASGEESASNSDIDMDIDDEDPAVLEALDKRLATHMKLVSEEKNANSRRKRSPQAKFTAVRRILSIIEEVAKGLRLRLASNNDDGRTGIVFLDLHCRLYEFVMNVTNFNGQFLGNICSIVSKQMSLPLSLFHDKVADRDTAIQIAGRFLNTLSACKVERSLSDSELQTISKSAACIVGVAAMLSDNNYEQFFPHYQKLVEIMVKPWTPMLRPRILSSFFIKAPSLSVSLLSNVVENLDGTETTKQQLARGSEIILQLARLTSEQEGIPAEKRKEFWTSFNQFLQKPCDTEFKGWNARGIDNLVKAMLLGRAQKLLVLSASGMEGFHVAVNTIAKGKRRQKLQKLLRSTSIEVESGELLGKASLRDDVDQAKKRVSKKRKLK